MESKVDIRKAEDRPTGHASIPSQACNNPVSGVQLSRLRHATIPSWHATIPSRTPTTPFTWYIHSRMLSVLEVLTVSTLRGREINILIVLCPDCSCFFFLKKNTFISEHVSIAVLNEKSFSTEISISL